MADPTEITARLREMIETNFRDGDRLPSEVRLSESLGVSRAKLRESFGVLWQAGLIEKKWGVGTIVRKPAEKPPVIVPLPTIRSAPALIRESGQEASATDLSIERRTADETVCGLLDLQVANEYWLIDRVFCADEVPIQRTVDIVRTDVDGIVFDASGFDVDENTLVALYDAQFQKPVLRATGRLTVVPAPSDTAKRLRLRDADPVLLVEYSTALRPEIPLSYSVTWYNTARVDVRFEASRPNFEDTDGAVGMFENQRLPASLVSSYLSSL